MKIAKQVKKWYNNFGAEVIEKIFDATRNQLKAKGYLADRFAFIDARALISKLCMLEERDKAISEL